MHTTLRLLFLRARANWRLLSVVGFGILVASVLMASTTLYTRALTDLGLGFDLDRSIGQTGTVRAELFQTQLGGQRAQDARDFAEASMDARFGDLTTPGRVRATAVGDFFLLADSPITRNSTLGVELTAVQDWESHVQVDGRAPALPSLRTDPAIGLPQLTGAIEVALPRAHAAFTGLAIGDTFSFADVYDECDREPPPADGAPPPFIEPCTTTALVSFRIPAQVVGIFDATDPSDLFWDAALVSLTRVRAPQNPTLSFVSPLFLHSDAFRGPLPQIVPGYRVRTRVVDPLPIAAFDSVGIPADLARFDGLEADLRSAQGAAFSTLERTLRTFELERDFSVVPILLILIQVVAIVFFFIVVMARLLVGRETDEILLLRGRGASLLQVLGLYTLQLTPIVLLAAAVAPLLAAAAISALGFSNAFQDVTGNDWIATPLTPQAWALALAGGSLALGAVLIPVIIIAHVRPGRARYVAARPAGPGVLQRYYLDIAFLAVAGFLVWAVSARDAVFTRDTVGGLSTDPLVLIAPALIGLIAVILVLRLLPPVLRAAVWLTRDRLALPLAAALRQAVRNPGPITRLSLLLMLAAALGTFAASYGGTVDRSFDERARYRAGVDLRVPLEPGSPGALQRRLDTVPGAGPSSLAIRRAGSVSRTGARGSGAVQLLGLDSAAAASFLWSRDDFSPEPLPTLLPRLAPTPSLGGLPVPGDVQAFSLWVNPSVDRQDLTVWLQVRDRDGRLFRVQLGNPSRGGEWQELRADAFASTTAFNAQPPFTLHAITFTEAQNLSVTNAGTIRVDDLSAITAAGDTVLLEGFESTTAPWRRQPLSLAGATDTITRRTDVSSSSNPASSDQAASDPGSSDPAPNSQAHSGDAAMEYRWEAGVSPGRRGIYLPGPNLCDADGVCALNVIASTRFLEIHGQRLGDIVPFTLGAFSIDVRIIAALDLFPTLDPNARNGFLLADVFDLHHLGATLAFNTPIRINEAWVSGPSDPGLRDRTVRALNELNINADLIDQRHLLSTIGRDPLVAAGGSGILLVSFIAVGILVVIAFLVSVVFTARERMLEMAVLRTLGIGRGALLAQMIVEYAIVATVGLSLGTVLGDRIARLMLRFLEVDEDGDRVLPPFVLTTDWTTVLLADAILLGVLAIGVGVAWRLYIRESVSRALRLAV